MSKPNDEYNYGWILAAGHVIGLLFVLMFALFTMITYDSVGKPGIRLHEDIEDLEYWLGLGETCTVIDWSDCSTSVHEEHPYYLLLKDDPYDTCFWLGLDRLPQNCSSIQDFALGKDKIMMTETGIVKVT